MFSHTTQQIILCLNVLYGSFNSAIKNTNQSAENKLSYGYANAEIRKL